MLKWPRKSMLNINTGKANIKQEATEISKILPADSDLCLRPGLVWPLVQVVEGTNRFSFGGHQSPKQESYIYQQFFALRPDISVQSKVITKSRLLCNLLFPIQGQVNVRRGCNTPCAPSQVR